ncbi:MAG: DUF6382 domain-containing protein [Paenibacillaceae bacterium]
MKANSIYGMKYETTLDKDSTLVFSKNIPWTEHDLIAMEKRMLLSYPIARVLPLELREMNLQITLCYKLGTKKPLSHILNRKSLNEMDCLRILFTIVTTLVDSKVHLLSEERYLIQAPFIYLGSDYLDVNLIYLPIYEWVDKPPLPIEFLKLATDLLQKQEKAQSDHVRAIMQMCNTEDFQLIALKERLLQAITEMNAPSQPPVPLEPFPQESQLPPSAVERIEKWRLPKSHNPHLITACVLSLVFIWGFYVNFSSAGMVHLCLGLSLLILDISFMLHRSLGKMETGELTNNALYDKPAQLQLPLVLATEYYEQLGNQTTLLAPVKNISDATVLLPAPSKAFLELKQGEETELIKLSDDSFIIGRNLEVAQFTANWLGLSRSHVMISRHGNNYEVKDLGSKNGSFLNEEAMVPHQPYPLNEGDCIKIVEKQFIYKKN